MNKLMARIVAVVMAIAMLGTVSFAASYDSGLVKPGVEANEAEAQETVLVFATNTANDQAYTAGDDKIIGIAQDTDVPEEIPVNAADLTGYDYITIAYGGSDGTTDYAYINIKGNVEIAAVRVEREYVAEDGKIYQNVAYAKFVMPTDGKLVKCGVSFVSAAPGATPIKVEKTFTTPVQISGSFEFEALVLKVPYGQLVSDEITATPYFEYAQN